MDLRSVGRKLSFDVLSVAPLAEEFHDVDSIVTGSSFPRSKSDPLPGLESESPRRRRKQRKKKKKKRPFSIIPESVDSDHVKAEFLDNGNGNGHVPYGVELECMSYRSGVSHTAVVEQPAAEVSSGNSYGFGELRQRSVGSIVAEEVESVVSSISVQSRQEDKHVGFEVVGKQLNGEAPGSAGGRPKLETAESLDWKRVMSEDPHNLFQVERSPLKYFMEEMTIGHSLRSTTTLANDKERERVYDTIFRLPWRCELLIGVGVFVCFDSFLSLLTIMPARILTVVWKSVHVRRLKKLSATELSDLSCFIVLVCGVTLLQQIDISLIYHMIRGQGTIKLYVVYNVLEIFDKLCQSFGGDVLQTLLNSADGLASCLPEDMDYWKWRYASDLALAVAASIVHSAVLLVQGVTLSACIVAHNNALMALLVSNNFAEIKSNVFKRFSKDNIHSIVYYDSVERFHILAFIIFVLAQNILEAEDPWFESFLYNATTVYLCEILIDIIKHSFISKFNDIKPTSYSEFLEDLCKQTLNMQTNAKNSLTFIPLAPACVVIRVVAPIYTAHLPLSPLPWRFFWMVILLVMTFVMLASLKVMIRIGLQKHAAWYVKRCEKRKLHSD